MPKITKRVLDAEEPDGSDRIVWDDELKGFGLRLRGGSKTFIVQYKLGGRGGQNRRILLGKVGVLTSEEARTRARRHLSQVADGKDPAADAREDVPCRIADANHLRDGYRSCCACVRRFPQRAISSRLAFEI